MATQTMNIDACERLIEVLAAGCEPIQMLAHQVFTDARDFPLMGAVHIHTLETEAIKNGQDLGYFSGLIAGVAMARASAQGEFEQLISGTSTHIEASDILRRALEGGAAVAGASLIPQHELVFEVVKKNSINPSAKS